MTIDTLTITIVSGVSYTNNEEGGMDDEEGYEYNIYDCTASEVGEDVNSIDGGFCSGSMVDALEMATAQAKEIIKSNEKHCPVCGLRKAMHSTQDINSKLVCGNRRCESFKK